MDNLGILVQAILSLKDTTSSKNQIAKELPKLESQLQSDKNTRVKIVAGLDIAKSKNLIQSQLNTLVNQSKAPTIKVGVDVGNLQSQFKNVISQSNNTTKQIIADEKKKQEAYKATAESVIYHAGVISKYNKAETNGRFYGSSRGTGYYGTGHYFVDSAHKSEIMGNSSFAKLPYTSVDISKYDNLFKANTDKIADELHTFLKNLTQYTQGLKSIDINSLFKDFQKVFTSATMNFEDFNRKVEALKSYMSTSSLSDRNDSVSTQFMKSLGYGGVDTRGTSYADTRYGTVIYDLKEESVLQANITNELQKQGQMLDKISYKTGEVFDKETDRQLAGKISASKLEAEAQAQYKKSFDSTNLTSAEKAYDNAVASLKNVNEQMVMYENHLVNAKKEAQSLAQEMKRYGITMTPEEIAQQENEIASEAKPKLEQLKAEKAMLEQTIPVLREKYETEQALANKALDDARKLVAQRQQEMQSIQAETNATNQLKAVQTQTQQSANIITNANNQVTNSARTISTQYRTEFGVVADVIKQAEAEFSRFGEASAVSNKSVKALDGVPEHFKDFTIQVKSATGEVQKFFYTFENVGDNKNPVFKYMLQNINEADAGVKKLADDIEKAKAQYTSKLAGFESTNSQIKTGLSAEIAKVNDEINKLGTNNGSIQNLKVAFDNLTASANKIKENLKATGASLNPIDNAINKYKNMDNVLKEITTSFNNLSIKPTGLGDSLNSVKSQLIELQNLEKSEGGYTETWAKKYRDVSLAVAEVKTNIELALKAEKSDKGSSYQTQLKYLNKIKEETNTIISLKRKMVNAGDEEKALYQHEITNAQKRIQYDVQQLEKKKLLTNEAKYLVNTYKEEIALQYRINNAKLNDKASTQRITDIKSYNAEIDKAITKLNSLNNSSTFRNNASNPQVTQTKQEINSLITAYQNLATKLQGNITPAGLETVRTKLTQLNARFNDATTTAKRFETELRSDNSAEQLAQKVALLTQRIKAYRQVNSKSEKMFGSKYDSMLSQLANPNIDLNAYNAINKQFQIMRQEINATNAAGKTLWQTLKEKAGKFVGWMSLTGIISSIWREMQHMVTNVVEIDKAMTNLKKVTDETDTTYARFLKNANQQAKELHSTVTDLIEQTSQWAKLGYNLEQANKLAEASMIYANVGEVDNEQAVTNIVSAVKAFDIAVDDIMSIPDVYNKLGNEFAVSSKNLGVGMSQAATTMALAGNDFNQVAALLTGAGEILGDNRLDEIGTGLKTVTLRIQNQAGALKELGEEYEDLVSVSKTQQQIYELTGGKVNIMSATDPNEFRDTYNILKDVANVINDLNGTDASELVQLLFGKNRANVGTAILKAFQSGQIEKAYEAAKNSAGSAQEEFDRWSQSIEAKYVPRYIEIYNNKIFNCR